MKEKIKLFGTDGVRGRANYSPMTVETALLLGRAVGMAFRKKGNDRHKVVVGKDTRLSCYMFENALISGLCSMGIDTLMVGPLPTPGVAFITRAYRADAGVMISASHNSYHDNGIKFFSSEGFKFSTEWEDGIEQLIENRSFENALPADQDIGKNTKIGDAQGRYIEFVKATFNKRLSLKGMKIALDCSNGAGYYVAPLIFKELDATVFSIGVNPNGLNINLGCGSLHPEAVQREVLNTQADVGIALDGDADRVILVDEKGSFIDGDLILAICAKQMFASGELENNKIVPTVMTNCGITYALEKLGIQCIPSQVGDKHVIAKMLEEGANLGGEQSGHMIFLDYNTTGDGLVTALQVLQIMKGTGKKLSELASEFKRVPQTLVNVVVHQKAPLEHLPVVTQLIKEKEKMLGKTGRVLVRYSGTESICRVMVEGEDAAFVRAAGNEIAEAIRKEIG